MKLETFFLKQNYPNPFNSSTIIGYVLQKSVDINLKVFDLTGREVITLVDDFKTKGFYQVRWDGIDLAGKQVASGTYIYRLKAGDFIISKTMLLLK